MAKRQWKCWGCKGEVNSKNDLQLYNKHLYHTDCITKKKIDEQREVEWRELGDYVKYKIFGYTKEMKFNESWVLRLKGLSEGKFMANKFIKPEASYSFPTILLTIKANYLNIMKSFQTHKFENENQKFNYFMAIIENNINDIVLRLKKIEKTKEESQNLEVKDLNINNDIKYLKKDSDKNKKAFEKEFESMW